MSDLKNSGKKLIKYLEDHGVSRTWLASKIRVEDERTGEIKEGIHSSNINQWEVRGYVPFKHRAEIERILNLDKGYLS